MRRNDPDHRQSRGGTRGIRGAPRGRSEPRQRREWFGYFEVVGETSDRDFLERGAGDVLLGFADADEVDSLSGQTAGVGGVVYV